MGVKKIDDETLIQTVEAYKQSGGNKAAASRLIGISVETFKSRFNSAVRYGFTNDFPPHIPSGFEVKSASRNYNKNGDLSGQSVKMGRATSGGLDPTGFEISKRSTLLDADGNITAQWLKEDRQKRKLENIISDIKAAFTDFKRPEKLPKPDKTEKSLLTLYPLADLHLGLYAWGPEADIDWDLSKAVDCYKTTMQRVNASSPNSETAIVLGGGDLLHADSSENKTAKSGNVLDVDTRYSKVLKEAIQLIVYQVELALEKHKSVIVRILPGNHDEHSSLAVTHALWAWFRNENRVEVDTDPSLFFWHHFGQNLIGAAHGHTTKINDMPLVMANRCADAWGKTKHRYIHGFHIHHKTQNIFEHGGVIAETHQAPTPQDAYHFGKAYLSGRSMQSITYCKENGEIIRNKVAL